MYSAAAAGHWSGGRHRHQPALQRQRLTLKNRTSPRLGIPAVDRIAMFIAAACGLHCICFPLLLAIATTSSFIHAMSEPVERGFIASAFVLGTVNLSGSWWRKHHRPECLLLFATGMTLIFLHDHIPGAVVSAAVSVAGGSLVGTAHFHNMRLLKKCDCCGKAPSSCDGSRIPTTDRDAATAGRGRESAG